MLCINYYNDTKRGKFVGFARLFEDEFGDGGVGRGDGGVGRGDAADDGASVSTGGGSTSFL